MKKLSSIILAGILVLLFTGCNPLITGMQIQEYPNKIVYVVGVDSELDLNGGSAKFIKQNEGLDKEAREMEELVEGECQLVEEVDFNTPGIYKVKIYKNDNAWVEFPIQVVDKDYFNQ